MSCVPRYTSRIGMYPANAYCSHPRRYHSYRRFQPRDEQHLSRPLQLNMSMMTTPNLLTDFWIVTGSPSLPTQHQSNLILAILLHMVELASC